MRGELAALLLFGCASSSIEKDVARVRELTRSTELAVVADMEVERTTPSDIKGMLRRPLDAEGAVRIALLNNRELRAELRSLGIARGDLVDAGRIPNPVFEVEALPERDTQVELRLEYDLTSLVLAPLRSAAAEAQLESQRYRAAGAVLDLGYRVRAAFYQLQSAEQRLAIATRSLDALAAARDAAEALLEAGNVRPLDALGPITAYERARVMTAELELEAAEQKEGMHRLLGLSGGDLDWRTSGPLADVPEELALPEQLETKAIEASLDLAEAKSKLEAIAHRTSEARTEGVLPDLEVDVHSLYGHPDEADHDDATWRFGAGVSLALPLFEQNHGTLLRHESEFDAETERFEQLAIDLRSAARETKSKLTSAHARALHYRRKILPAQKRVVDQALLQYNAMQIGVFDLLEAHRTALDLELELVETLREYWSAKAGLDALLAGCLVTREGMRSKARPAMSGSNGGH